MKTDNADEKRTSSFAYFLETYKNGMIKSNEVSLKFHTDELSFRLNNLKDSAVNNSDEFSEDFKKITLKYTKKTLELIPLINWGNPVNDYIRIGLTIDQIVSDFNSLPDKTENKASELLKKIIYHYLSIAQWLLDKRVKDVAIQMAEKYLAKMA